VGRFGAPLMLIAARARRRPGRFVLAALGIALAAGFAGAVVAEATLAADQSARSVLAGLGPLNRTVRVSWQGPVTTAVSRQAQALLRGLGLGPQTRVVLMNPVRLSGIVVRPAAIYPLDRWVSPRAAVALGSCRPTDCPMLLAGSPLGRSTLSAAGVRIKVAGSAQLSSPAPLGFTPTVSSGQPPVLLTGDVAGLSSIPGLSGIYRSYDWLALLPTDSLQSWELAGIEARLQRAQAGLLASASQFSVEAPFDGLDQARAQARAAPQRLLLSGGGALAALALFIVLAAGGLRRDQNADLERLRIAGARTSQCALFVVGESAWLSGLALVVGACLAVAASAVLATPSGVPVGGLLTHSLLTPTGAIVLVGGWVAATALVSLALVARGGRLADVLAVAAAAALALALTRGGGGGDDPLPVLLAPLCSLAAGVITFRVAAVLLRGGERLARRGPALTRLALVGLARAPAAPSLGIAFLAVSIGLGGFALSYRATLLRGTADQAANQVPLDAVLAPGADFTRPLQLAPIASWQTLARGRVLPVRRTEATYANGGGTVTVPALGVPASGLTLIHGWRDGDGSAALPVLAGRLATSEPVRVPGPRLGAGARWLAVRVSAPTIAVSLTADLRDGAGTIRQVALGTAAPRPAVLSARIPPGRWELEALELDEPTGLDITNGHQNGENPAAATQGTTTVALGPIEVLDGARRTMIRVPVGTWRAVGAATSSPRPGSRSIVSFAATGQPGLLRPLQPSDIHRLPVLVDPQTAASAGPGGLLSLTVDEQPVAARVVGVLRRFPALGADVAGFVIADDATLASALDAQLPGQGRADELWIATAHRQALRDALAGGPVSQLSSTFRADVERQLRSAPIARGVLGTLLAAAGLAGALAVLGLVVSLLGAARDERVERDLEAQGVGPRRLRSELRMRLSLAGALGVLIGLVITIALTGLAVTTVQAATTVAAPSPPLVTVVPWGELAVFGLVAILALITTSWLVARSLVRRRPARLERRPSLERVPAREAAE
jgi:hypothetical protein